mmetsp:Transcript_107805/g.304792  ORF Transcript_107805/g.304792 Transcript_107805/m.304792 type:complete len:271 (-) Transcript_107805:208-1020(-)
MSTEYDTENIFAQIIEGKIPAFKVFESKASLAFLDAFPMVPGHTLLVPKTKGHKDLLSMPPAKATEFMRDLQKVAQAVKEATGATGINIWQNSGADAGQSVLHPHFHIVPRHADDGLVSYPASGDKLSEEAAAPMLQKITDALNPPEPLKKATFGTVGSVRPDGKGLNLKVKIVEEPTEVDTKGGKFWEVLCGDATGTAVLSLRENQKDVAKKDAVVAIRNAGVKMVQGHVRLAVDKWGKVEASEEGMDEEVDMSTEKNISATEYELVQH